MCDDDNTGRQSERTRTGSQAAGEIHVSLIAKRPLQENHLRFQSGERCQRVGDIAHAFARVATSPERDHEHQARSIMLIDYE